MVDHFILNIKQSETLGYFDCVKNSSNVDIDGNLLSLYASISLGLLAASLTLLAIYPAIIFLLKEHQKNKSNLLIEYNKYRRRTLKSLGVAIFSAWFALFYILLASQFPSIYSTYILKVLTFVSLLSVLICGYFIFQVAKKIP